MRPDDPHKNCAVHYACARLDHARLVVLAAHGRYGVADNILIHADQVAAPDVAWVAPQAAGNAWWDESFLAPLAKNEPGLLSAIAMLDALLADLEKQGFGPEHIVLAGFSQGACLMLEYAARNPRPFRGIIAMSGGLLGSAEGDGRPCDALYGHAPKQFDYSGDLSGVPVKIGCHEEDPVIPVARVRHSGSVLGCMGADVAVTVAPGKMHGVLESDIQSLKALLAPAPPGV